MTLRSLQFYSISKSSSTFVEAISRFKLSVTSSWSQEHHEHGGRKCYLHVHYDLRLVIPVSIHSKLSREILRVTLSAVQLAHVRLSDNLGFLFVCVVDLGNRKDSQHRKCPVSSAPKPPLWSDGTALGSIQSVRMVSHNDAHLSTLLHMRNLVSLLLHPSSLGWSHIMTHIYRLCFTWGI